MADLDAVEHDVRLLTDYIRRLGTANEDGSVDVTYGVLFDDDDCQQTVRAIPHSPACLNVRRYETFTFVCLYVSWNHLLELSRLPGNVA